MSRPTHAASVDPGASSVAKTDALHFLAPYPPSTNNLYMTVKAKNGTSRRVKTPEAKGYAYTVGAMVWMALRDGATVPEPPYVLTINLYPPSRRPDASNGIKCLEDALFVAIKKNDRTVQRLVVEKHDPDPLNPRAEVILETAP